MNNLSWFIYIIQVVDNFGFCFGFLMLITVGAAIATGIQLAARWPEYSFEDHSEENKNRILAFTKKAFKIETCVFLALMTALVFLPSRQTMLLIAGSEIGERVVKSDQVTSVVNPGLDLLKSWIVKETAKLNVSEKTGGDK